MAQENSFDVVSKIDMQEARNAIDQAIKEIRQRFDLKDTHSEVNLEGQDAIQLASSNEYKLEAVKDILCQKLVKRGVSLKNLTYGKIEPATGQSVRQKISLSSSPVARLALTPSSAESPPLPTFSPSATPVTQPRSPPPTPPTPRRCRHESARRPSPPADLSRIALRRSMRLASPVDGTQVRRLAPAAHRPSLRPAIL